MLNGFLVGFGGGAGGGSGGITQLTGDVLAGPGTGSVPATVPGLRPATEQTTTSTGSVNNFDLNGHNALVRCNNATLLTLTGLTVLGAAPTAGDRVTIVSVGAGQVNFAHLDGGSTDTNQLLNIVTSTATPIAAGSGNVEYVYDATTQRWRLITHEQGAWITPAFSAGDYTGNGSMTWTVEAGDVNTNRVYIKGRSVQHALAIVTTSVGGTPSSELNLAVPWTIAAGNFRVDTRIVDAGTGRLSFMDARSGPSRLIFFADAALSNWAPATNTTNAVGIITYEIE